jgi:hypothetical protein
MSLRRKQINFAETWAIFRRDIVKLLEFDDQILSDSNSNSEANVHGMDLFQ